MIATIAVFALFYLVVYGLQSMMDKIRLSKNKSAKAFQTEDSIEIRRKQKNKWAIIWGIIFAIITEINYALKYY